LQNNGFRDAALTAVQLYQDLGHSESEGRELLGQIHLYEAKRFPFDLAYTPNIDTPKLW